MDTAILPLAITMMAGPQILSAIIFVTGSEPVKVSLAYVAASGWPPPHRCSSGTCSRAPWTFRRGQAPSPRRPVGSCHWFSWGSSSSLR